jgi:hypothetical protein
MADEIVTNISVVLRNGFLRFDFKPAKILTTQAGNVLFDGVRSIATTETSVALTGITTPKICILHNLDATNYCEAGTTTTDYPIKLFPTGTGIPNVFTLNAGKTTLYLKANTAATKVRIIVLEA